MLEENCSYRPEAGRFGEECEIQEIVMKKIETLISKQIVMIEIFPEPLMFSLQSQKREVEFLQ